MQNEMGNIKKLSDSSEVQQVAGDMRTHATQACAFLKALANEDRLMLLCQLTTGSYHVAELEAVLGIRQPTLSQQLGVLRKEGLVATRREGKYVYYSIGDANVLRMMKALWDIYCAPSRN